MPLERHVEAFNDQAKVLATVDVGSMWDRMRGEFLDEWARLDRQGLSAAEMDKELLAFMDGLSVKPQEHLARTSSGVAYNQGRSAEILSANVAGKTEFVVRSEVLDANTCEVCANLDGGIYEVDSPAYHEFLPPSKCLGGDNCRGFYVAVAA